MNAMDRQDCIIAATSELIAVNGLAATPMSLVARHAGCGAGTIYRYFETKEVLIEAVYLSLMARFSSACLDGIDDSGSVKTQLSQFWLNLYHYLRSTPQDATLFDQLSVAPAISEELQIAGKATILERITPLLEQGRKDGIIRDLPDDVLGIFIYGGLSTLLRSNRNQPGLNQSEVTDEMVLSLCWGAVGTHY